eukprot:TRINITY_DN5742_c2_g3_i1.p1 TRINITY_DN5742_c2_g3~~TRINITY_DN5742_c2_g3_i1.p1  ORF type:complete len:507 (+),score=45.81 TRINITY_DN5742_c2_g3_i1:1320-2840(+)
MLFGTIVITFPVFVYFSFLHSFPFHLFFSFFAPVCILLLLELRKKTLSQKKEKKRNKMSENDDGWKDVCAAKALSGNRALVSVPDGTDTGRYVAVIRHRTKLHAIDATCYHMGGPLLMADIEEVPGFGSCVVCPWHRYQITLEKGLKVFQSMDGQYTSTGQCKQRVHEVKINDDRVLVKLNMSEENVTSDDYAHKKPAPAQGSGGLRSGMLMSGGSQGRPRNSVNQMIANSMRGGDGAAPWSCSSSSTPKPPSAPPVIMSSYQFFRISEISGSSHPTEPFHLTLKIKVTGASFSLYGLGKHVEIQKGDISRFYTPFTTPSCSHDECLLLVRSYPKGRLSPYICSLKVGDRLAIRGPLGGLPRGFLDGVTTLNAVCGGTGVTPLLQILASYVSKKPDTYTIRVVNVLLSVSSASDIPALTGPLKTIQLGLPFMKINLDITITGEPPSDWTGLTGRVRYELLKDRFPPLEKTKIIYCGSDAFNETVKTLLGCSDGGVGYQDDAMFGFC